MSNASILRAGLVLVSTALFGAFGCGAAEDSQPRAASPATASLPAAPASAAAAPPAAPGAGVAPVAMGAPAAQTPAASPADPPATAAAGDMPAAEAIPVPGSDYVHGRASVVVKAPIQRVRETVLDFGHYAEFMPHYRTSKVLGRTATGARDVYMEVEALHGVIKMWAEIEVPKPVVGPDGTETIETKFIKGNVKGFLATWRFRKIDDASTQLSLEVFLDPGLQLPTGLVNKENLGGSADGVVAMRGRVEQAKK